MYHVFTKVSWTIGHCGKIVSGLVTIPRNLAELEMISLSWPPSQGPYGKKTETTCYPHEGGPNFCCGSNSEICKYPLIDPF